MPNTANIVANVVDGDAGHDANPNPVAVADADDGVSTLNYLQLSLAWMLQRI